MNRKELDKKIIAEKGQKYFDDNKGLLDAQFEYIESLGDPDDINDVNYDKDLVISYPEKAS